MSYSLSFSRELSKSGRFRRMVVTITEAVGLDENVFLYRQLPLREGDTEPTGRYEGVCSASDMVNHPTDEPEEGAEPPWFRLNRVDLLLDSETETLDAWLLINEHLQTLLNVLNGLDSEFESEVFELTSG